jgi:hypothetical protein
LALTKQYGFWQDKTLADTRKKLAELYFENPQVIENEKRALLEFWQSYEGLSQILGEKLTPFKSWFFTSTSPETVSRCLRALREDGTITLTPENKNIRDKQEQQCRSYWSNEKTKRKTQEQGGSIGSN